MKKNQHRPAFFDSGERASPAVLTQTGGGKEFLITHTRIPKNEEKNPPDKAETLFPTIPHKGRRLFTGKRSERKKPMAHFPHSCLFNVALFGRDSRLQMINRVAHGNIGTHTMEGVVLASEYNRATCLSFPCSPARSPWEPVAAVHGEIKQQKKKKSHLIIIVRGITQRALAMRKQINLPTQGRNRARSEGLEHALGSFHMRTKARASRLHRV